MPSLSHIIHKQLPPPLGDVEYIYNDDQFIIVDKPANMLSVPGKTPEKQDCLIHRVQQRFPEALIVTAWIFLLRVSWLLHETRNHTVS